MPSFPGCLATSIELSGIPPARPLSQLAQFLYRHFPGCPLLPVEMELHVGASIHEWNLAITTYSATHLQVPEGQHMLLHGGSPLIVCTGADLLNAIQIQPTGHCPITSIYRQGHGDRTRHALIIKILFFSSEGSSRCTRNAECWQGTTDGQKTRTLGVNSFLILLSFNSHGMLLDLFNWEL